MLTLATSASAAPGDLSDVPLYTRGGAEPNIMFVLDSSGSMEEEVWPPGEYDDGVTYDSCSGAIPATYTEKQCYGEFCFDRNITNTIQFRVNRSDGLVEISSDLDDSWQEWDSTGQCFDPEQSYQAWIYAKKDDDENYFYSGESSGSYRKSNLDGNFLNWYFSQSDGDGGYEAAHFLDWEGEVSKSKVELTRTNIMKSAASELLSGLEGVRVGLMQFNSGSGATVLKHLASIDGEDEDGNENRDAFIEEVSDIDADGSTPLAESFSGVGRYFSAGYLSDTISYTNKTGALAEATAGEIFSSGLSDDDLPAESAIQYYCQKNFMVALTDGAPTSDDSISSILQGYDYNCSGNIGGCTNDSQGYSQQSGRGDKFHEMDDVIAALYDIDLRQGHPEFEEPDGTAVKHNIISYVIGFAEDGLSETPLMKNSGELGRGGVYDAGDASELRVTFNQIINKVHAIVGSSSSVAFNSTSLETGSALYAAKFDSGDWSGELSALTINSDGSISSTSSWEAGTLLNQVSNVDSRVLLSYKPASGETPGTGVAFTSAALIDGSGGITEEDLKLNTSGENMVEDTQAGARLAYLRGDRINEANSTDKFRVRGSRLGDIVNSTPVYVGAPAANWSSAGFPEASSYAQFKTDKSSRTPMVYVGANDGFLHGFNASATGTNAGKELIGYSPAELTSEQRDVGLHALSSQNYQHKYYVDGTPTVVDAYLGSGVTGAWKSILVGGLGGGGKGYYALDVTDPSSFSEANAASLVLWEFTDDDNSNLGYSFSRPQIGRMANGKWAAVFGNGYDSDTGDAGLFIVYLDGSGHVYLPTGVGSTDDQNGLSTPAIVDSDLDGTIDRVYAGDLRGNMWAFDVESTVPGQWTVETTSGTSTPLFTISGQAITGAPLVARNTANENGAAPNLLVTFGTGQYLTDTDTSNTAASGFYAVSDNGNYGKTTSNLESRALNTRTVEGVSHRTLSGNAIDWTTKSGWYIPLQSGVSGDGGEWVGGERVVTRPDLLRNILFFNTLIPTGAVCSAGGYGWMMSVDVRTGLAPEKHAIYDANGDGEIDSADMGLVGSMVSEGIPNKPGFLGGKRQYTSTSAGTINERDINVGGGEREGRLSWEEIVPE